MKRVVAYVDGFNLYFGLKDKGWRRYYWLNVQALVTNLLKSDQQLVFTKYFTARVLDNVGKQKRQTTYLEALETLADLSVYEGVYQINERTCPRCGSASPIPNEKGSDVNIAVELLADAFQNKYDVALIVSADSDLIAAVETVKRLFLEKNVVVAFPPSRFSRRLANVTSHFTIGRNKIAQSQFPETITKPDGFVLRRPSSWADRPLSG